MPSWSLMLPWLAQRNPWHESKEAPGGALERRTGKYIKENIGSEITESWV